MRAAGYRGRIAAAAQGETSVDHLRELGVDVEFVTFRDAAERAVDLLMGEHRRQEIEIIEPEEQKQLP